MPFSSIITFGLTDSHLAPFSMPILFIFRWILCLFRLPSFSYDRHKFHIIIRIVDGIIITVQRTDNSRRKSIIRFTSVGFIQTEQWKLPFLPTNALKMRWRQKEKILSNQLIHINSNQNGIDFFPSILFIRFRFLYLFRCAYNVQCSVFIDISPETHTFYLLSSFAHQSSFITNCHLLTIIRN